MNLISDKLYIFSSDWKIKLSKTHEETKTSRSLRILPMFTVLLLMVAQINVTVHSSLTHSKLTGNDLLSLSLSLSSLDDQSMFICLSVFVLVLPHQSLV
jgi:hypothetical protein